MVRTVTIAQYNAMARQYDQKLRQRAQKIDQHNRKVIREHKHAVDKYNREVQQYNQKVKSVVARYNVAARQHNAQIASDRQRLLAELKRRPEESHYVNIRTSTYNLNDQFQRIHLQEDAPATHRQLLDISERESKNSLSVMNALLSGENDADVSDVLSEDTGIIDCLQGFSEDLCKRWQGAVFALNPQNPDAARHFSTSIREVFTEILEITAPDADVLHALPDCELIQHSNKPTRRSKINYLLKNKGIDSVEIEKFVEDDIKNIIELFEVFNSATHGLAGKLNFEKLQAIKKRVECGVMFLASLAVESAGQ